MSKGKARPLRPTPSTAYINAGMYLMEREAVSLERDIFPGLCGRHFFGFKGDFPFIDIGTPESFQLAGEFFAAHNCLLKNGRKTNSLTP